MGTDRNEAGTGDHSTPHFTAMSFHAGFQQLTTCAVLDLGSAEARRALAHIRLIHVAEHGCAGTAVSFAVVFDQLTVARLFPIVWLER